VSKKDMRKAREAEEKREEDRKQRIREQDAVLTSELLAILIRNLDKGESVLEALQRLGKAKTKQKPKWQKNKRERSSAMEVDEAEESQKGETERKAAVEAITEAADQLLSRGKEDVYDAEREVLMRLYQRETGDSWVDAATANHSDDDSTSDEWQFKWTDSRDGGILHGPYDIPTLRSWSEAGYFANGDVEFRKQGRSTWTRAMEFL
jgi:CD2 antigen cytoplasmic tail-binding protein 2